MKCWNCSTLYFVRGWIWSLGEPVFLKDFIHFKLKIKVTNWKRYFLLCVQNFNNLFVQKCKCNKTYLPHFLNINFQFLCWQGQDVLKPPWKPTNNYRAGLGFLNITWYYLNCDGLPRGRCQDVELLQELHLSLRAQWCQPVKNWNISVVKLFVNFLLCYFLWKLTKTDTKITF